MRLRNTINKQSRIQQQQHQQQQQQQLFSQNFPCYRRPEQVELSANGFDEVAEQSRAYRQLHFISNYMPLPFFIEKFHHAHANAARAPAY